jgi:galactokinase
MTGGGFGGCAVLLVRTGAVTSVMERIRAQYARQFAVPPTLFVSRPAAGASMVHR